ncbi:hypothetical protein DMB66_05305 [Actinoplanes sp. ATCC 53533]|nr:hypothetical protein DMB66_05305 [Actinoplanes sp. ATCC 53533]
MCALVAAPFPGAAAAAAPAPPVPLPVAAVLVSGARTALVVDLSASTRPGRRSVTVTRDGAAQRATLVPVMADGLAVALVVDTSVAGAATLPAWLSAAARFILEAPASTQAVVIADSAPAAVTVGPQRGPTGVVRALTSVRARGERDTAAALGLAVRQFPGTAAGRRVVVLYTTGADAGGEGARALATRFRASGTILVVVGTVTDSPYWASVAAATGGFFAPSGDPVVIPALDQVKTTLNGRYLVQFPTPPVLPARVSVRIDTGDLSMTGDAIVTAPAAASRDTTDRSPIRAALVPGLAVAGLAAMVIAAVLLRRRRSRPLPAAPPDEYAADPPPPWVVRGRAAVPGVAPGALPEVTPGPVPGTMPGVVARGRATVPEASRASPE